MDYLELRKFIEEEMEPHEVYQPYMIRLLLEKGEATRADFNAGVLPYSVNPARNYSNVPVFSVLTREDRPNGPIVIQTDNKYRLNLTEDLDTLQKIKLISLCNKRIYKIRPKKISPKFFNAAGSWNNWFSTFGKLPVRWGVEDVPGSSNKEVYDKLSAGDIVFFYANTITPVSNPLEKKCIFGYGIVTEKPGIKPEPYWDEEVETNEIIWPLRFHMDVMHFVDTVKKSEDVWELKNSSEAIELHVNEDHIPVAKGLNVIANAENLDKLLKKANSKWNTSLQRQEAEPTRKIWKSYVPNDDEWDNQLTNEIVTMGFSQVGNMEGENLNTIEAVFKKKLPEKTHLFRVIKDFRSFSKGDIVVAVKSNMVKGIGKIVGSYKWRPELKRYPHTYAVDWYETTEVRLPTREDTKQHRFEVWPLSEETLRIIEHKIHYAKNYPDNKLPENFVELIDEFNRDRKYFDPEWPTNEEMETERSAFLNRFPIKNIPKMKVEEYAPGGVGILPNAKTTMSYMVERQLRGYGRLLGGAAKSFAIKWDKIEEKYDNPYHDEELEKTLKRIKQQISTVLKAAEDYTVNNDLIALATAVQENDQPILSHVISKIMAVYFPDHILSIHSRDPSKELLGSFGINYREIPSWVRNRGARNHILRADILIKIKQADPIMKGWSLQDYSMFLFEAIRNKEEPSELAEDKEKEKIVAETTPDIAQVISKDMIVDIETTDQIVATLDSGKNILLVGPVGTGKTDIAQKIPKALGYFPYLVTANADWTTHDVIGGIMPQVKDGAVTFSIQKGCAYASVSANWADGKGISDTTRNKITEDEIQYNGKWLVIDEFNRAPIDRAFGQMFTAVEYKMMIVPSATKGTENVRIPNDYRIIGTYNAHDRHYLFKLSDALKRRFAIIEIGIPEYNKTNWQRETYFVARKAMEDFGGTCKMELDDDEQSIIFGKDETAEKALTALYEMFSFVRLIKPLGTAFLISMFSFILSFVKRGGSFDRAVDLALYQYVAPQLEDLLDIDLKIIRGCLCEEPGLFFKSLKPEERESPIYSSAFGKYANFLNGYYKRNDKPKIPKAIRKRFVGGNLTDDDTGLLNPWETIGRPKLISFRKELDKRIIEKGGEEYAPIEEKEENETA